MVVKVGDIVRLRDGRVVEVTDALDYSAPEVQENPDNIFVGRSVTGATVVSNTQEVVSILE